MKYFFAVLLSLVALAAGDKYTTKYDDLNLDDILKNDRLLNNYFKCIMDKGKCTVDGQELKKRLPEALEEDCAKCSEKQRQGAAKVLKYVFEMRPDMFDQLEAKYDPEAKYRTKYREKGMEIGVKV